MADMTILLYVNLSRDCEGAYPQSVAYEIPAGCYEVELDNVSNINTHLLFYV